MTSDSFRYVRPHYWGALVWIAFLAAAGFTSGCSGGLTWANTEEELELPVLGVHTVLVRTDNGDVQVRPTRGNGDTIQVRAVIRAGGRDEIDAQNCLDAIDIVTPTSGPADSVQEIRWAWKEPKQMHWQCQVSFEITLPATLDLKAETENGKLDVAGVTGACELKSKNGAIRAWAVAAERLVASTANGQLDVESPAAQIDLNTRNGKIVATLSGPAVTTGHIETQNGEIRLSLDPTANVRVKCQTSNGRITSRLPLRDVEQKSKKRLAGRLGEGGGTIEISTQNGGIKLDTIDPRRVETQYID